MHDATFSYFFSISIQCHRKVIGQKEMQLCWSALLGKQSGEPTALLFSMQLHHKLQKGYRSVRLRCKQGRENHSLNNIEFRQIGENHCSSPRTTSPHSNRT